MKTIHELKSWTHLFAEIVAGHKTHELRRNDRNYEVGDILLLKEFDPQSETYSGRTARVVITYITDQRTPCAESTRALDGNYCILSVRLVSDGDGRQ